MRQELKRVSKTWHFTTSKGNIALSFNYHVDSVNNEVIKTTLYLFDYTNEAKRNDITTSDTYKRNLKNFEVWFELIIQNFTVLDFWYEEEFTYKSKTYEEYVKELEEEKQ